MKRLRALRLFTKKRTAPSESPDTDQYKDPRDGRKLLFMIPTAGKSQEQI